MKYVFFLSHPAHFHLFKNTIRYLKKKHEVHIIIKSKDILADLLQKEGWHYHNAQIREKKAKNRIQIIIKSIFGLIKRDIFLLKFAIKNKPDLMIGTEWAIVHIGALLRIPSIVVNEDDTIATPENKYFYRFATHLLLPKCCDPGMWDNKRVTYSGYHELAYLHPENFNADLKIIEKYELKPKSYFIVRLVKLTASHDTGKEGLKKELLNRIISKLSTVGKVYITSEQELDESLQPYRLQVNPLDIHHILAFAKLYIGDSQTMAAEAGVLGTPFIRYNDFVGKIGYLNELERKYVLGYGFKTNESNEMIKELERMITNQDLEAEWLIKKNKMLNENINLAEFMNWLFEKYPESIKILKESPNYEERFK